MSLTDNLCAALIHSLHFHMWPLFYQWVGIEEEQVDRGGAAVLANLPVRGAGICSDSYLGTFILEDIKNFLTLIIFVIN